MQPNDPGSWYPDPPRASIMTEMYQHQVLWDNRQYPRVHQAFAEIWGTEQLWVSIDRASMNPPELPDWKYPGKLHWDTKLEPPIDFWVQGVLYLTDTAANQGSVYLCAGIPSTTGGLVERPTAGGGSTRARSGKPWGATDSRGSGRSHHLAYCFAPREQLQHSNAATGGAVHHHVSIAGIW